MVKKFSILFIFIITISFFARTNNVRADFDCLTLSTSSTPAQKSFCQNELDDLNQQLAKLTKQLSSQQKKTGSFKSDIDSLTQQIDALKLKIKSRVLAINNLKVSINEKAAKIETLQEKIAKEHQSLAQLLRNTNEFDNENIAYLVLSNDSISSFYSDLESYDSIKKGVKNSVDTINGIKTETEAQKIELQKQKDAQTEAKDQLENAQKKVAQTQAEKKQLLDLSKQKEADYQKVINDRQKRIAEIKSRLFSLAGASAAIRFDVALGYAEEAAASTGIDPAFLLAIITQESRLGANVGQCNKVGDPDAKKWNRIMPGPEEHARYLSNGKTCKNSNGSCSSRDDQTPFLEILSNLGLSPEGQPISCPIVSAGPWGGAMGPAQFIPSTWKLIQDRVRNITGSANPWSPRDAFTASSIYLTDLGGKGTSIVAQQTAACKYYGSGGSACSYGTQVTALKNKIQGDIDYLKLYGVAKN
ncbi:MAG: lytic murein transglycosylase [Candidatus Nomurabacteria bacterium]|nr:lytic murein transglycosylase [Candidatus Nomurabacteria bacterium]